MTDQLLQPEQRSILESAAASEPSIKIQRRARIILFYDDGKKTKEIAESVGLSPRTVRYWCREFRRRGMDVFSTHPDRNSGKKTDKNPGRTGSGSASPGLEAGPSSASRKPFPRLQANPGIQAGDPMSEAGRKILCFHFAHMLEHEAGTRRGEDIEDLHDMRVATRRMRVAFEIFKPFFKPKAIKHHLQGLRATGRALGRVRDLDVLMEKAGRYIETLPEADRPGMEPLLAAWRGERARRRDKMLSHLEGTAYQQFKLDFNDFISTPGAGARQSATTSPRPDLVQYAAPVLIYTNLGAVRAYEPVLPNATIEQLHALRIEFKKLRYIFEFFREVLGRQSGEVIKTLKAVQDHLGDLNDANVACQVLREFLTRWEERQALVPLYERQNPQPIVTYLAAKHAERHKLMVTFPQTWAQFNSPEFMDKVALSVSVL
jgi:CHAD domain-containing protein